MNVQKINDIIKKTSLVVRSFKNWALLGCKAITLSTLNPFKSFAHGYIKIKLHQSKSIKARVNFLETHTHNFDLTKLFHILLARSITLKDFKQNSG